MARRTIRLSADADERLRATAKVRGYANPSALARSKGELTWYRGQQRPIGGDRRPGVRLEHAVLCVPVVPLLDRFECAEHWIAANLHWLRVFPHPA